MVCGRRWEGWAIGVLEDTVPLVGTVLGGFVVVLLGTAVVAWKWKVGLRWKRTVVVVGR